MRPVTFTPTSASSPAALVVRQPPPKALSATQRAKLVEKALKTASDLHEVADTVFADLPGITKFEGPQPPTPRRGTPSARRPSAGSPTLPPVK